MQIFTPISGQIVPLSQVPDEVFSNRIVGEGISIDPTHNILYSPCDGVVEFVHPSKHALTIKSELGLELLIHLGVDTVTLKGEGFNCAVKKGDRVKKGQLLIEFDADFVATSSKSLLTQILITNAKDTFNFSLTKHNFEFVEAKKDLLLEVDLFSTDRPVAKHKEANPTQIDLAEIHQVVKCLNQNGLHARPASQIATLAKTFQSEVFLEKGSHRVNAKSIVSILTLEVAYNDQISILAKGQDANVAALALVEAFKNGLGENSIKNKSESTIKTEKLNSLEDLNQFMGNEASPGISIGKIYPLNSHRNDLPKAQFENVDAEIKKFENAISISKTQLIQKTSDQSLNNSIKGICQAHIEILEDPVLFEKTIEQIRSHLTCVEAWQNAIAFYTNQIRSLKNKHLAEREIDIKDVGYRVLNNMLNRSPDLVLNENTIVVCQSLTPTELITLNSPFLKGIVTVEGGSSSHTAIIARSLNIPYLTSVDLNILSVKQGINAILNTSKKSIVLNPTESTLSAAKNEISHLLETLKLDLANANLPAVTLDKHLVQVFANVGKQSDVEALNKYGADGVGLVRTEFLFLDREFAPSESEQSSTYKKILQTIDYSKKVFFRTLDVGGDKPLSYLPLLKEDNPFLGVRGIRFSFKNLDLFKAQIRALISLNSKDLNDSESLIHIMFPMITTLEEFQTAKGVVVNECQQMKVAQPKLGIMVEVPSVAIMAEAFAEEVDFLSIGSNDLTQYTLAIDRGNASLANDLDGLHPAVLRLIGMTVQAGKKFKKHVGICGSLASDPEAIPILIGLGIDELSVSLPNLPKIKSQIRKFSFSECEKLATAVLKLSSAKEVRSYVNEFILKGSIN